MPSNLGGSLTWETQPGATSGHASPMLAEYLVDHA